MNIRTYYVCVNRHGEWCPCAHEPSATCDPIWTEILGCLIFLTRSRQYSLFTAYAHSSYHEPDFGASMMSRSPSCWSLYIANTACLMARVLPSLSIWPSHCKRRALIHSTMSNVLSLEASACIVFPVITLTILELAPFNVAFTFLVSLHASDPYVRTLHVYV